MQSELEQYTFDFHSETAEIVAKIEETGAEVITDSAPKEINVTVTPGVPPQE
mgnify:CR=1 FL=1